MPSPFPGMDPYLEDPDYWRGVHTSLIALINTALNEVLPQGYVAHIEARLYVMRPQDRIYPDVALLQSPAGSPPAVSSSAAVVERADAPEVAIAYPQEVEEPFIQIRTIGKPKRVVTVIEILSPANKASGSIGRHEYLEKQQDVLQSDVHLVEIDLLRQGAYTVAAPQEDVLLRGRWDYLISLHRWTEPHRYEFWRNSVRQRLPRISVPLADNNPDVMLDLQTLFDRCYDAGRFRDAIDYTVAPPHPLTGDDAVWMDALLREKGLRP